MHFLFCTTSIAQRHRTGQPTQSQSKKESLKKKQGAPIKEIHFERAFPEGEDEYIHDFIDKVRDNWACIPHIARKDVPINDLISWFQFTK